MNRREILTGTAAAAAGVALGVASQASDQLNYYLGARSGEEKTKAAAIERLASHYDEDSVVIQRLRDAPECRVFYVDCGNMSRDRAERHMREVMARHRSGLPFEQANLLPPSMRA